MTERKGSRLSPSSPVGGILNTTTRISLPLPARNEWGEGRGRGVFTNIGLLSPTLSSFGICLAVAVVALRQPRRVQRRNDSDVPLGLRDAFAPLHAALLVAARRVLPR